MTEFASLYLTSIAVSFDFRCMSNKKRRKGFALTGQKKSIN